MAISEIELEKHYKPTFAKNIKLRMQQTQPKFKRFFTFLEGSGEATSDDFLGKTETQEKTDRYGDTPNMQSERFRRWCLPYTAEWGDQLTKEDKIKQMLDPASALVRNASAAFNRSIDRDVCIPSFFDPVPEGKDVATAMKNLVEFDDQSHTVPVDFADSGTPHGVTVAKIKNGIKRMKLTDADLEIELPVMALHPDDWEVLMDDIKIIHGDYIKDENALMDGKIPSIFKCRFVESTLISKNSSGQRELPLWLPSGVSFADWMSLDMQAAKDPGKKFNLVLYGEYMAGAMRNEEGKVQKILVE